MSQGERNGQPTSASATRLSQAGGSFSTMGRTEDAVSVKATHVDDPHREGCVSRSLRRSERFSLLGSFDSSIRTSGEHQPESRMREIRPYGSEGGGAAALPTPILMERARGTAVPLRTLLAGKSRSSIFLQLPGDGDEQF
jgi:hypothetical protein